VRSGGVSPSGAADFFVACSTSTSACTTSTSEGCGASCGELCEAVAESCAPSVAVAELFGKSRVGCNGSGKVAQPRGLMPACKARSSEAIPQAYQCSESDNADEFQRGFGGFGASVPRYAAYATRD